MNRAMRLCVVVLAFTAILPVSSVVAQDAFVGSWVLDTASSKGPPGLVPTAGTLEITSGGDGRYTYVSEAALGDVVGRTETTMATDGKEYATATSPAPPGAPAVTQAIERVSDTVYKISVNINGELVATSLNELSSDRSTLTQTSTGLGQFAALSSTMVFRRK